MRCFRMIQTLLLALITSSCLIGTASAERNVFYPDVNEPLRTGEDAAHDAAVVISIEHYPLLGEGSTVPFAHHDGDGIENFLLYTRGVKRANLHRLQDKASKETIEDAMADALKEARGGTLWFYFAGHGAASKTEKGQLLLGADVQASDKSLNSRSIDLKDLQAMVNRSSVQNAVFIIDACSVDLGKRFAAPVSLSLANSAKNIVIWSAASEGEKSGPLKNSAHGAFTYAVLGALRGWADGEIAGKRDGSVDVNEAQAFTARFLKEQDIRDQNPKLLTTGNLVLSSSVSEKMSDLSFSSSEAAKAYQSSQANYLSTTAVAEPESGKSRHYVLATLTTLAGIGLLGYGSFSYSAVMSDEGDWDSTAEGIATACTVSGGLLLVGSYFLWTRDF